LSSQLSELDNARLSLVQVRLLYGPLLACVTASKSAFTAMVRQHGDGDTVSFVRAAREDPDGREGKTYRCTLYFTARAPHCNLH